jgi:uncharacterized protein YdhG (YjbR/CyaY superfamily)
VSPEGASPEGVNPEGVNPEGVNPEVTAFIEGAPAEHRPVLEQLRQMIREAMPDAAETFQNGFAVYEVDGEWTAGFASRKKGPMLYIMVSSVLDDHAEELGRLRSGRTCIEWKDSRALPLDELEMLAETMLLEAAQARGL